MLAVVCSPKDLGTCGQKHRWVGWWLTRGASPGKGGGTERWKLPGGPASRGRLDGAGRGAEIMQASEMALWKATGREGPGVWGVSAGRAVGGRPCSDGQAGAEHWSEMKRGQNPPVPAQHRESSNAKQENSPSCYFLLKKISQKM